MLQGISVQLNRSFGNLQPGESLSAEFMFNLLTGAKQRDVQSRILMNCYGALGTVRRGNQAQVAAFFLFGKRFLLVSGLVPVTIRQNPDLQEMNWVFRRRVRFAVANASARTHALPIARMN